MNLFLFFFNDTATTEIYTLSLHDALPISCSRRHPSPPITISTRRWPATSAGVVPISGFARRSRPRREGHEKATIPENLSRRSEEHTSELQSQSNLLCRLLLEKNIQLNISS